MSAHRSPRTTARGKRPPFKLFRRGTVYLVGILIGGEYSRIGEEHPTRRAAEAEIARLLRAERAYRREALSLVGEVADAPAAKARKPRPKARRPAHLDPTRIPQCWLPERPKLEVVR